MAGGKKTAAGRRARGDVLVRTGFPADFIAALGTDMRVPPGDFLDACAALWTAERIAAGSAERFPTGPDLDSRGLDQAIWF